MDHSPMAISLRGKCISVAVLGCCDDYSHANRFNVDIITNIVCIEEYISNE